MPCSCCFALGGMNRSIADEVESIVAYFLERVAEEAVARWWFRYSVGAITFPYEDSVGRRFSRGNRVGLCGWGTIVDVDWGNYSPECAVYPWYILYVEKRTTMSSNLLLIAIDHRLMGYY